MNSISLEHKKVFVFDWDGTILDSMQIKFETFSETLSKMIGKHVKDTDLYNKIKIRYQKLSGLPRKEIFENILKEIKMRHNLIDYYEFNNCLMETNKKSLETAKIFSDAEGLLKTLIRIQKIIFISSSIPQNELDFFTNRKLGINLINGISGVLGSSSGFHKGEEHFDFIQKKSGYNRNQMIFIGDDLIDYQLSVSANVDCVLVEREDRYQYSDILSVSNLTILGDMIRC